MKCILVMGANGFVGRAMCERMLVDGWQVWGTVRSAKGEVNLPTGVEVVQIQSIGPDTDWSSALAGVDTVIHLAAWVHVMSDTSSDPLTAFRKKVEGQVLIPEFPHRGINFSLSPSLCLDAESILEWLYRMSLVSGFIIRILIQWVRK